MQIDDIVISCIFLRGAISVVHSRFFVIISMIAGQACTQTVPVFAQNYSTAHPRRSQQFLVIRRPRERRLPLAQLCVNLTFRTCISRSSSTINTCCFRKEFICDCKFPDCFIHYEGEMCMKGLEVSCIEYHFKFRPELEYLSDSRKKDVYKYRSIFIYVYLNIILIY